MKSPYPQSGVNLKDFQRARNKMQGILIEIMNEEDKKKLKLLGKEFMKALRNAAKEAKKCRLY